MNANRRRLKNPKARKKGMVKMLCDKCGKEMPQEGIDERRLYIKWADQHVIKMEYCSACKADVINALGYIKSGEAKEG